MEKIRIQFVGQFDGNGGGSVGYHSQWRPDKEEKDLVATAKEIRELNGPANRKKFPRFFTWTQEYEKKEVKKDKRSNDSGKNPEGQETGEAEVGEYLSSSEKTEIILGD